MEGYGLISLKWISLFLHSFSKQPALLHLWILPFSPLSFPSLLPCIYLTGVCLFMEQGEQTLQSEVTLILPPAKHFLHRMFLKDENILLCLLHLQSATVDKAGSNRVMTKLTLCKLFFPLHFSLSLYHLSFSLSHELVI